MANIGRQFLTEHGVPDDQLDAIMGEINQTINNRLSGYVPQSEVQARIDAAMKNAPKPDPVDPKTTAEYLALAKERDMLRTTGGADFAVVKPQYREYMYGMLDHGEKAKPYAEQLTEKREQFGDLFFPAQEPAKDQPKNTPQYSQQPGHSGVNQATPEDELYQQLSKNWGG